jgi:hypothetical protein
VRGTNKNGREGKKRQTDDHERGKISNIIPAHLSWDGNGRWGVIREIPECGKAYTNWRRGGTHVWNVCVVRSGRPLVARAMSETLKKGRTDQKGGRERERDRGRKPKQQGVFLDDGFQASEPSFDYDALI